MKHEEEKDNEDKSSVANNEILIEIEKWKKNSNDKFFHKE